MAAYNKNLSTRCTPRLYDWIIRSEKNNTFAYTYVYVVYTYVGKYYIDKIQLTSVAETYFMGMEREEVEFICCCCCWRKVFQFVQIVRICDAATATLPIDFSCALLTFKFNKTIWCVLQYLTGCTKGVFLKQSLRIFVYFICNF